LAELIVVLSLLPVVIGAVYMLFFTTNRLSDQTQAQSQATEQTRPAVEEITNEVRQSAEIVEGQGVFCIAEARRCAFYSDVDHDGTPELVTYRVSGQTLYRSVADATTPMPPYTYGPAGPETAVVTGIDPNWTDSVFAYYNDQDPATQVTAGDYADISALAIHIINTATVGGTTASVDVSTWVKIRSVFNSLD
jgi:hypothetical protein